MNNKNFLLVISKFPPEYSGPGVRIPRLYKYFQEKGCNFDLKILCNGVEKTRNETYLYEGWTVRRITAEYLGSLFLALGFMPKRLTHGLVYQYEFIKTFLILCFSKSYKEIDFLHVAGHSGGTAAALLWSNIKKIPVLMELVTEHARHQQKLLFIFKVQPYKNSKIVTLTEKTKQECIRIGVQDNKLWCRPNPIDSEKFKCEPEKRYNLRKELTSFNENQIVIGNVAKIIPQKNQYLILEALQYLPGNFVTLLAGPFIKEGPLLSRDKFYLDKIHDFIRKSSLENRVCLITDFVDAEPYMKLSDIYAMPAYNEGFGTPMIEAIGCGLPVIANKDEYAFQEWIVDGYNGFLCDIYDPRAWAKAIENAAEFSKEQCLDISKNIHKKAGQEVIYKEYKSIIKNLLQSK